MLASNPCPCGRYGSADEECSCTPAGRRRYLARLSGPLLDRVDIRLTVRRHGHRALPTANDRTARTPATPQHPQTGESATAAARDRLRGTGWTTNAQAAGTWLRAPERRIAASARVTLDRSLERGALTMRGYDRTLRLAWTLADLDGAGSPTADHVARALYLRRGVTA